jgi:hypothetical protein
MSFWKVVMQLFGHFLLGIGLLLVILGLILGTLQDNLQNSDWIVDESVDIFFEENQELIIAEFGEDYSDLCDTEEDLPDGFCDELDGEIEENMVLIKDQIKSGWKEALDEPLDFNFNMLYLFSICFVIPSFLLIYFGHKKDIKKFFRGIFLHVGIVFILVYFVLWKFVSMTLENLLEMFNVQMDNIGVFMGLVGELVERLLFEPLRGLLPLFLIVGLIGIVGFILFLVASWKKKK